MQIQFNIEKSCYNAGMINKIGCSVFPQEEETLIPPYSVCCVKKIMGNWYELDLAQDNKHYDFSMKAEC